METAVERLTGIFFLVTGLSHVFQPRVWVQFFIRLREKEEVGSFINAFVHFPLGAFIVAFHNVWHGFPGVVVTLMGWGLMIKGSSYFILPRHGMRMLAVVSMERAWHFVVAGILSAILGAVLIWSTM